MLRAIHDTLAIDIPKWQDPSPDNDFYRHSIERFADWTMSDEQSEDLLVDIQSAINTTSRSCSGCSGKRRC